MATSVTKLTHGLSNMDQEIHIITWEGTDATEEVTTGLSVIYAAFDNLAFGADAGHTDNDLGILEIDETKASDGSITVSGGAITVNRIAAGAGTLAGQLTCLVLFGKS